MKQNERNNMSFKNFYFDEALEKAIDAVGFKDATEIQKQAIPIILQGQDVLASAQTGTGKTAAFLLPLIQILMDKDQKARVPRAVVLSPTRELAEQIAEQFDAFAKDLGLTQVLLIGGVAQGKQTAVMRKDVDVIIATPGRLIDLIEQGKMLLHQVNYLIIDEADRMLDMGFIPDIEKILKWLPKKRQSLLFSATLPKPIQKLSEKILLQPKKIFVTPPQTASGNITQYYIKSYKKDKSALLSNFLDQEKIKLGMIFCNRKRDIPPLAKLVSSYGYKVLELHGDMTQPKRKEALEAFRKGQADILICSDVASRGVDIDAVSHVVNFETPVHFEDYIHRIGRTGRAGEKGVSLTFVDDERSDQWKEIFSKNKDILKPYGGDDNIKQDKKEPAPQQDESSQKDAHKTSSHKSSSKNNSKNKQAKTNHKNHDNDDTVGFGDHMPSFFGK